MPTGWSPGCALILRYRLLAISSGHAELVDVETGRDMRMGAGVDIGIHAHRDSGTDTSCLRGPIDSLQLSRRFGVDRLEVELNGAFDLIRRLADTAEHDVGGIETGAHRELDLTDRIGIDRASQLPQEATRSRTTSSPSARNESGADGRQTPDRARDTIVESIRHCRRRAASRTRGRCPRAVRHRTRARSLREKNPNTAKILHGPRPLRQSFALPIPNHQSLVP